MFNCKFCNKEFNSFYKVGGHTTWCKLNPNRNLTIEKARKNSTGKKLSKETKKKISDARKKYLLENPEKVPYLINHSSNKSFPQKKLENALKQNNILGWVSEFRNGLYSYDIAFPELKIDIEIDGETHLQKKIIEIDKKRDEWSINEGWRVLRIPTKIIYKDINNVINEIKEFIGNDNLEKQKIIDISLYLKTKTLKCNKCGKERHFKSKSNICQKCYSVTQRKIIRPNKEVLLKMVSDFGFKQVGRIYGVTDNTIRKWIKFYNKYE